METVTSNSQNSKPDKELISGEYFGLPPDLNTLPDGIDVDKELKEIDYKTLRADMFEQRAKFIASHK